MDARHCGAALLLLWIALLPGEAGAQERQGRFQRDCTAYTLGSCDDGGSVGRLPFRFEPEERSTGLERIISGWIFGSIGLAVTALAVDAEPEWVLLPAYGTSSAVGIGFATATREGIRPLPVAIGTAVGAVPWGIAAATKDRLGYAAIPLYVLSYAGIPVLGSVAHGLAAR